MVFPRFDYCRRSVSPITHSWRAASYTVAAGTGHTKALDLWVNQQQQLKTITLSETLHTDRLSDLYVTLPTRDGTRVRRPCGAYPKDSEPLGFGHHLAFFHPRTPERYLRPDGTDADFCPPEPFVRRMWAGGRIEWKSPLIIGGKANARMNICSVDKKGFEGAVTPKVFVNQRIEIMNEGDEDCAIAEERTHVYLALGANQKTIREVRGLPQPDFSFKFVPTLTTLFRFSALAFNAHRIHLDHDFAKSEGYPERIVHGPLTALILLETLAYYHPEVEMRSFEYRALNPIIVNREVTFYGSWNGAKEVLLWVQDEAGVVGMQGRVLL